MSRLQDVGGRPPFGPLFFWSGDTDRPQAALCNLGSMSTDSSDPPAKRQRLDEPGKLNDASPLPFHPNLFDPTRIASLASKHAESQPYHHAVVDQLFQPEFLKAARKEITEQLSFTEKETDICASFFRRVLGTS